jgi:hypothetical protein
MNLLGEAMSGLGAALLPVAAALLFEELTFGGLVRLLIAPWPEAGKHGARGERLSQACGRKEHNHHPNQRPVCGEPGRLQPGESGGGK